MYRYQSICLIFLIFSASLSALTFPIVDTGVHNYYSNVSIIAAPQPGNDFYGQDACYQGNEPSYTNNGDGTITDNLTGLMWQQNMGEKISFHDAFIKADTLSLGGYTDWRMPSLKELYSLIQYTGQSSGENSTILYIDTNYFDQPLGSPRPIDAQTWSSNKYRGLTMQADSTVFGVNFVDGRIKGYPMYQPGTGGTTYHTLYARMVRNNPAYGINSFVDNADGTITDSATGLMWQQADDGISRDWENALASAENLNLGGYTDWRLPNVKELQSIVDYTRCPDATNSAAIDPLFETTMINDPNGNPGQYPYFWSSTSHLDGTNPYTRASYVAFGEAQGKMNGVLMDVHGAGAQRSDPKSGVAANYPQFMGPQGDVLYVYNYVRAVRTVLEPTSNDDDLQPIRLNIYPNPVTNVCTVTLEKTSQNTELRVYNLRGALVTQINLQGTKQSQLDLTGMASGIYFLQIKTNQGITTTKLLKL